MAADRITIYAGPPVAAALDGYGPAKGGRDGDAASRSGRLAAVCERYLAVAEHDRPRLARGEWLALCDVLNGTLLDPLLLRHLDHEVEDADRLDGLGAKWRIDARELAAKIGGMTMGQRVAVAETVERWWRAEGDPDERLAAALGRRDPDGRDHREP